MYKKASGPNGEVLQSAMPKREQRDWRPATSASGLLVRGVVVQTHVYDADVHNGAGGATQNAIYCDVLGYSGLPGNRTMFFPNVLVTQERSGMHEGDVWIPRAATLEVTDSGQPGEINLNSRTNPSDLDGDHVLLGFMDNDLMLPVILRSIPHPRADVGNTLAGEFDIAGHRLRIASADGEPRYWKHRGALWGVDTDGNFVIDTRRAHQGAYVPGTGAEPAATENGDSGNVTIRMQAGTTLRVVLGADRELQIDEAANRLRILVNNVEIGNAATQHAVHGEEVVAALNALAGAVGTALTAIQTTITALAAVTAAEPPVTPGPLSTGAGAPLLATLTTAMVQASLAIAQFQATNYLSSDVQVR